MIDLKEKIIIVIVHFNSCGQLLDCVENFTKNRNNDILIVDNASTDGTLEKCEEKYKELSYIKNSKNLGFATGANIGTKEALKLGATHVLLCNPDAVVEKKCVDELVRESNKNIGVYSPIIFHKRDNSIWFSGGVINYIRQFATHKNLSKILQKPYQSDYISGCVMLINKEVFESVGFFDEDFFLYYEDADFSLRAQKKGFCTKIVPSAVAFHDEQSEKMGDKKIYFLVLAGLIFFQKNTPLYLRPWWLFYTNIRLINAFLRFKLNKKHADAVWKAFKEYKNKNGKKTNIISNS